ncbi:uncharacterized protein METZ01_LOCUS308516, partial [marine metagenome]
LYGNQKDGNPEIRVLGSIFTLP